MQGRLPTRKQKKKLKQQLKLNEQKAQTRAHHEKMKSKPKPMNAQVAAPILHIYPIFSVFAKHLTLEALYAFSQTSQLAKLRVDQHVMGSPKKILHMLGECSRRQAAQFFQQHRHSLGMEVLQWLEENPDNHAAYTLYLMMCCVRTSMVDLARLDKASQYLQEQHYSERIQASIHFIGSFLKAKTDSIWQRSVILKTCLEREIDFYINLRGANLTELTVNEANFCGADLRSTDMSEGTFRQCDFSYADMVGTEVTRAEMQVSTFIGTNLRGLIDENDMGNFHQSTMFCGNFFSYINLQYVAGKTIYPTEKVMLQAIAENKRELARLNKGAPYSEFVLYAMTNDFLNAVRSFPDIHKLKLLEFGLTSPLFATHYDYMPAFINEKIMHLRTTAQAEIDEYKFKHFSF